MTVRLIGMTLSVSGAVSVEQIHSTPDNSNLQGKSKTVRVIGSSKKMAGSKEKNGFFFCKVNTLITLNSRKVKRKLKDTSRL